MANWIPGRDWKQGAQIRTADGIVHRRIVPVNAASQDCDWCGDARHGHTTGETTLFQYGISDDMCRITWDKELFCCFGCRRNYYG